MKYLLIFLISFNLFAMSHERIDNLTVQKTIHRLILRMEKVCERVDDTKPFRVNNITCENGTPTLSAFENELTTYKAELHIAEDARLAEVARVKDLRQRFKAVAKHHQRRALNVPNPAAWIRDNIKSLSPELMAAKMIEIESKAAGYAAQDAEAAEILKNKVDRKVEDCRLLNESNNIIPDYLKRLLYEKLCAK